MLLHNQIILLIKITFFVSFLVKKIVISYQYITIYIYMKNLCFFCEIKVVFGQKSHLLEHGTWIYFLLQISISICI